jgi:hypothetical protein
VKTLSRSSYERCFEETDESIEKNIYSAFVPKSNDRSEVTAQQKTQQQMIMHNMQYFFIDFVPN